MEECPAYIGKMNKYKKETGKGKNSGKRKGNFGDRKEEEGNKGVVGKDKGTENAKYQR